MVEISSLLAVALASSCASASVEPPLVEPNGGTTSASAGAAGSSQAAAGEATSEPAPPPPGIGWCDAQPILAAKCGRCHGDPPAHGAPFALATHADVQLTDSRGRARYERMQSAIESGFMPATFVKLEPPVAPLEEPERQQLLDWLVAGAPAGDLEACPETP